MANELDKLATLLDQSEVRLRGCRQEIDAALDALQLGRELLAAAEAAPREPLIPSEAPSFERDELVRLVAAALENGPARAAAQEKNFHRLVYRADEDGFRIGRRQLGLTEMEKKVLEVLWRSMPHPVSRAKLHRHLYPGEEKATPGAVNVFVSKLRQKLSLAGGGATYFRSIRGKGWVLNPDLCQAPDDAATLDNASA